MIRLYGHTVIQVKIQLYLLTSADGIYHIHRFSNNNKIIICWEFFRRVVIIICAETRQSQILFLFFFQISKLVLGSSRHRPQIHLHTYLDSLWHRFFSFSFFFPGYLPAEFIMVSAVQPGCAIKL